MEEKITHQNIAFFIPHLGCPHNCSFCDQKAISGEQTPVKSEQVESGIISALKDKINAHKKGIIYKTEICFFGGSFTAIDREYMLSLLKTANKYLKPNKTKAVANGIRISTRPDCITPEILQTLKQYGVTSIELGCQSTNDEVLTSNGRGHTFNDTVKACQLIKQQGFELGLQMMAGLYKDTEQTILQTCEDIISLKPQTVRIYPVVILKNTHLATLYAQKKFIPLDFEKMITLCSQMLLKFHQADIKVIKLGLHSSEIIENNLVGGFYHPALNELCQSEAYFKIIKDIIKSENISKGHIIIFCPKGEVSKIIGQKKSNLNLLEDLGYFAKIKEDFSLRKYTLKIQKP